MRRFIFGAGLLAAVAVGPVALWAGPYTADPLSQASGVSPFATCTADNVAAQIAAQPGSTVYLNSEVEPYVDVNPTNPMNIVGSYQQDRWSNGGARGLVSAYSFNGGLTWTQVVIPKITLCSGGTAANGGDYKRATDPWLSFGPTGILWHVSLSLDIETPPKFPGGFGKNAIFVSRSDNGGQSWSDPVLIASDTSVRLLNDKETITADPFDPNYVYVVWDRLRVPFGSIINPENVVGFGFHGPTMFSRTTDGGRTWEAPRVIFPSPANQQTIGNQIVVVPDGTLVDVFNYIHNRRLPGQPRWPYSVAVIRSEDKGEIWTKKPIIVSPLITVGVVDPDTEAACRQRLNTCRLVRTGDIIPEVAVNLHPGTPGYGNIYVVWQDSRFSGFTHDDVAFSRSTDGGFTWSTPVKVNKTPPRSGQAGSAFTPMVRVAADGTVGVSYYDFRNHVVPSPVLETDAWLVHSHDGGVTWDASETRLTPTSFDMRQAPYARGYFVGDYVGLGAAGSDFKPFFGVGVAVGNPSDIVATTVGP